MLIDIDKSKLRLGMFVEAVACPAREFAKKRFVLQSQRDLEAIQSSSALLVQINTALGHAPRQGAPSSATEEGMQRSVEQATETLAPALMNLASNETMDVADFDRISSGLAKVVDSAPDVFVKITRLKTKDKVTYEHSVAVSALMSRVGQVMELSDDELLALGISGLVHDVGKLSIEDTILKKPGALGDDEKAMMRTHPQIGYDLLNATGRATPMMLEVCLYHHELLDGSGYPEGRMASALPLHCRIAAVCDVFEALTSVRPYKTPWPSDKALRWLYDRPHLYDYRLVGRLHEAIMPHPVSIR